MNVTKATGRLLLLVCFSLVTSLRAEPSTSPEGSGDKEARGRQAWFVQTGIPREMENPAKVLIEGEIQMLTLSNRTASGPLKISKDGIIRLVKEVPHPENVGEVVYQDLARARVPEGVTKALVVMVPRPKPASDGSLFATKVTSLGKFKSGGFMYLNLTNTKIGIEIADDKISLNAGGMKIHAVTGKGDLVSIPYRYSYYHPDKGGWLPLSASMTILSSKRRQVFVFSPHSSSGRIRCKEITIPGNI